MIDKRTIPLYLFLSGAGTGKSRNARLEFMAVTTDSGISNIQTRWPNFYSRLVQGIQATSQLQTGIHVRRGYERDQYETKLDQYSSVSVINEGWRLPITFRPKKLFPCQEPIIGSP